MSKNACIQYSIVVSSDWELDLKCSLDFKWWEVCNYSDCHSFLAGKMVINETFAAI